MYFLQNQEHKHETMPEGEKKFLELFFQFHKKETKTGKKKELTFLVKTL